MGIIRAGGSVGVPGLPSTSTPPIREAPPFRVARDRDPIAHAFDDPAIQGAFRAAMAFASASHTPGVPAYANHPAILALPDTLRPLAQSPFSFAVLAPVDRPAMPRALDEAEQELMANADGLKVRPEDLQRPNGWPTTTQVHPMN